MADLRKSKAKVESVIKNSDPEVIIQRSFYDEVSNRLYLTVVKGLKEIDIIVTGYDLDNGDESFAKNVGERLKLLEKQPIS